MVAALIASKIVPGWCLQPRSAEACEAAWDVYRRWQKPLLTLWGDHCPFTHGDLGRAFRTAVPGAQRAGIEHEVLAASHFIQEDRGEELAAKIIDFVRRSS